MDVVTLGAAKADAKKNYAPKKQARRSVYLTGAPGTGTTFTLQPKGTIRFALQIPFNTSRWRLKIRNYNAVTSTSETALQLLGAAFGTMTASNTSNAELGTFSANASTRVIPDTVATIPGDGTWYTSPWITDPATQMEADTPHLIAVGYGTVSGSTLVVPRGTGYAWHINGDPLTSNGYTSGAPSGMATTPLEYAVEYESTEIDRVVLFIGDSITEGVGGGGPLSGQPRYRAWPDMWGVRTRTAVVNIGISGGVSGDWTNATTARWSRYDAANISIDASYIGLGANDAAATTTPVSLTSYQNNIHSIISNIHAKVGKGKPIYLGNVTPRTLDNVTTYADSEGQTREGQRLRYNSWLESGPRYTHGTIDFDKVVRNPANNNQLFPAYADGGTVHMSKAGYNAMQMAVGKL